jgi:hypothetical protein
MLFVPDWQTHRFPALVQRRRTRFGLQSALHRPVHSSPCRTHQQGTGIRMAAKEVSATGSSGDTSSGLPGPGTSGMEVLEVPKVQVRGLNSCNVGVSFYYVETTGCTAGADWFAAQPFGM